MMPLKIHQKIINAETFLKLIFHVLLLETSLNSTPFPPYLIKKSRGELKRAQVFFSYRNRADAFRVLIKESEK